MEVKASGDDVIAVHETVWSVHVLHLFGDLDLSNAADLEREIESTACEPRVVIDLSNCNYVDSTAIRTLLYARQSRGDAVRLVAPEGSAAARAVRIAAPERALPLHGSLAAAVQW